MSNADARRRNRDRARARHIGREARGRPIRKGPREDATDEELLAELRSGDDDSLDTLVLRFQQPVRMTARRYFLMGADHDDIVQEGLIGLYNAILEFDAQHDVSFRTFAGLCITRQIISALKTANRYKHLPLNNYVSLHRPVDDGETTLDEVLPTSPHADPAAQVIFAEQLRELRSHFNTAFSDFEAQVLRLHAEGKGYQEIARTLRRPVKAVDNALQRIKRKLEKHFV